MPIAAFRRYGLALAATALMLPTALRINSEGPQLPDVTVAFAVAIGLVLAASPRLPPRASLSAAAAAFFAAAIWTGAQLLARPDPLLPTYFDLVAIAVIALCAWSLVLAGSEPERLRRASIMVLAVALVASRLERHDLLPIVAPDDAVASLGLVALAVLAFAGSPRPRYDALALACALGVFAFTASVELLVVGYRTDAVVAPHRAAELLLEGKNPYATFDMVEALARFGLPPELATHLVDGPPVGSLNYPAASFLAVAPVVAFGGDIRWLFLAELLALAIVVSFRSPWPALTVALVVGNALMRRQYVVAGVDPLWMLGVSGAWLFLGRRWLSPIALGLGAAARQTAWFFVPFYLVAVARRDGPREAARRAAVAFAVFAVPNLPFVAADPSAWLSSVMAPLLGGLEPHGVGLVRLGLAGLLPLAQPAYTAAALLVLAGLLALLWLRGDAVARGTRTFPLVPLFFAWRSLQNYFVFLPLLCVLGEAEAEKR